MSNLQCAAICNVLLTLCLSVVTAAAIIADTNPRVALVCLGVSALASGHSILMLRRQQP